MKMKFAKYLSAAMMFVGAALASSTTITTGQYTNPTTIAQLAAMTDATARLSTNQHMLVPAQNGSAGMLFDYDVTTTGISCPTPSYVAADNVYICPSNATTPPTGRWVRSSSALSSISGLGTDVATALSKNVGANGSFIPRSGTLPNSVDLGNVTNDVQTKAAVVPNVPPNAGQILVGNAGGTAYAPKSLSGSCTVTSTGVMTCTVNGQTEKYAGMQIASIAALTGNNWSAYAYDANVRSGLWVLDGYGIGGLGGAFFGAVQAASCTSVPIGICYQDSAGNWFKRNLFGGPLSLAMVAVSQGYGGADNSSAFNALTSYAAANMLNIREPNVTGIYNVRHTVTFPSKVGFQGAGSNVQQGAVTMFEITGFADTSAVIDVSGNTLNSFYRGTEFGGFAIYSNAATVSTATKGVYVHGVSGEHLHDIEVLYINGAGLYWGNNLLGAIDRVFLSNNGSATAAQFEVTSEGGVSATTLSVRDLGTDAENTGTLAQCRFNGYSTISVHGGACEGNNAPLMMIGDTTNVGSMTTENADIESHGSSVASLVTIGSATIAPENITFKNNTFVSTGTPTNFITYQKTNNLRVEDNFFYSTGSGATILNGVGTENVNSVFAHNKISDAPSAVYLKINGVTQTDAVPSGTWSPTTTVATQFTLSDTGTPTSTPHGSFYYSTVYGAMLSGKNGSIFDLVFLDRGNNVALGLATNSYYWYLRTGAYLFWCNTNNITGTCPYISGESAVGALRLGTNATDLLYLNPQNGSVQMNSSYGIGWTSALASGTVDTLWCRQAAGVVEISASAGCAATGSLLATNITLTGTLKTITTTVSGLPTVGTAGRRAFVTDATACTLGTTVVGGGSTKCPVYDDGTNWKEGG